MRLNNVTTIDFRLLHKVERDTSEGFLTDPQLETDDRDTVSSCNNRRCAVPQLRRLDTSCYLSGSVFITSYPTHARCVVLLRAALRMIAIVKQLVA